MNNIIVQKFNVRIEGKGIFAMRGRNGEFRVPMFGFNKEGEVLSRRIAEKDGYSPLKQKWVDKQIILSAEDFRQSENIKDAPVYIALIEQSDAPNEIGIAMDSDPMFLDNSSIVVEKDEYKL